jgi:hypothetical protein
VRRKNGSRPLDLGPFTRQLSDQIGGARGLTLLTPGRLPDLHRDIDIREIGVPEVEGIRTSQVSKSWRDQPSILRRTRGRNRCHRGKARQDVDDQCLGHRDIGDPGDKVFMHFGIENRETPIIGSQLSASWDPENRESRGREVHTL